VQQVLGLYLARAVFVLGTWNSGGGPAYHPPSTFRWLHCTEYLAVPAAGLLNAGRRTTKTQSTSTTAITTTSVLAITTVRRRLDRARNLDHTLRYAWSTHDMGRTDMPSPPPLSLFRLFLIYFCPWLTSTILLSLCHSNWGCPLSLHSPPSKHLRAALLQVKLGHPP
jgi:hypothetical protein